MEDVNNTIFLTYVGLVFGAAGLAIGLASKPRAAGVSALSLLFSTAAFSTSLIAAYRGRVV